MAIGNSKQVKKKKSESQVTFLVMTLNVFLTDNTLLFLVNAFSTTRDKPTQTANEDLQGKGLPVNKVNLQTQM